MAAMSGERWAEQTAVEKVCCLAVTTAESWAALMAVSRAVLTVDVRAAWSEKQKVGKKAAHWAG